MNLKVFDLEKINLVFREDKIVEIRVKDYNVITIDDAKEQYELIEKHMPNQKVCMLIVPGIHTTISTNIISFVNSKKCIQKSKAEAVVLNNLANRITYNFLSKFSSRKMKGFDCEEKALEWLKQEQVFE